MNLSEISTAELVKELNTRQAAEQRKAAKKEKEDKLFRALALAIDEFLEATEKEGISSKEEQKKELNNVFSSYLDELFFQE